MSPCLHRDPRSVGGNLVGRPTSHRMPLAGPRAGELPDPLTFSPRRRETRNEGSGGPGALPGGMWSPDGSEGAPRVEGR